MSVGPLFDRIVVVDWSANSTPKRGKDSIWIASFGGTEAVAQPTRHCATARNLATRFAAVELLVELTHDESMRTLVAVDFSLGYPRGTAEAFGLSGTGWIATWELLDGLVRDDDRNANNRFDVAATLNRRVTSDPGPYWGRPHTQPIADLTTTKVDPGPLPEWRHTEEWLRLAGHRPFSSWQLLGAGAVGSQSILGIAAMHRFRNRLRADGIECEVWPFTTGLTQPDLHSGGRLGGVVIAEVWPALVELPDAPSGVRDELQVRTLANVLHDLDAVGGLGAHFSPPVVANHLDDIVQEEGWVLGAGTALAATGPGDRVGRDMGD